MLVMWASASSMSRCNAAASRWAPYCSSRLIWLIILFRATHKAWISDCAWAASRSPNTVSFLWEFSPFTAQLPSTTLLGWLPGLRAKLTWKSCHPDRLAEYAAVRFRALP